MSTTTMSNDTFSKRLASMVGSTGRSAARRPTAAPAVSAAAPATAGAEPQAEARPAEARPAPVVTAQPVGGGDHIVRDGECISSIAKNSGHFWETLWNEPQNAELKSVRLQPNVLLPQDRVFVPPLRPKSEPGQTELRHRFVRRGEPAKLRMVLKRGGQPRANEPYTLEIDGKVFTGTLDPEGKLERPIPGNAKRGTLTVGAGENRKVFPLNLGGLDPLDALTGVQARLNNVGCGCGAPDGKLNEKTVAALRKFQSKHDLKVTGEPDAATRAKLKEVHGY